MSIGQQLQKIFVHFKKSTTSLPLGCGAIELVDEDDISVWFVRLDYLPDAAGNAQAVSVKLQFRIHEGSDLMPMVFVIQPRIMAPFIHHGAICSLELMGSSWAYTVENVALLIQSLQATLDPRHANITVDRDRPTYTSAEHENGMRHIKNAHATLFRRKVADTTTHSVAPNDTASVSHAPIEHSGARNVTTTLSPHDETVTNDAELFSVLETARLAEPSGLKELRIRVEADKPLQMTHTLKSLKSCRIQFAKSGNADELSQRANPKLVWSHVINIPPGCELTFDGIDIEVPIGALTVGGSASFTNSTFVGSLTAEGSARVHFSQCQIVGTCQSRDGSEALSILDRSHVELSACKISRIALTPQSTVKYLILVSNEASLRLSDGCVVRPTCCEKTIFAEQEASLVIAGSTIVSGSSCAVAVQACLGTLSDCILEGPLSGDVALQVHDSCRPTGLNGELGARLHATNCVARNLYFGFSVIGFSMAEFDCCFVDNVVNGFTVDASTATVGTCDVSSNHVGLFVLQNGKCVVTSSTPATSLGLKPAGHKRSKHPLRSLTDPGRIAENFDARCSQFMGGVFGVEVRHACLVAGGVFVDGATDTCVYVYDEGSVELREAVIFCGGKCAERASESEKRSSGVKLFKALHCQMDACFVGNSSFSFAAIQSSSVSFNECFASGGMNGFTVDASTNVTMANCGSATNHVGIFVLNGSNMSIANSIEKHTHTLTHLGGTADIVGGCFGVEVRGSVAACCGVRISNVSDSAFNCYDNSNVTLTDCAAHNTIVPSSNSDEPKHIGVKAYSGGKVHATRCHVSGVAFGYAALGLGTNFVASECTCSLVSNGFTIDAATATLLSCRTESLHVGVFVLKGGKCTVDGGDYAARSLGLEAKQATLIAGGGVRVHGFDRSGVMIYDGSSAECTDLTIEGTCQLGAIGVEIHGHGQTTLERLAVSSVNWAVDICGSHKVKATMLSTDPATCRNGTRLKDSASLLLECATIRVRDIVIQTQNKETSVGTAGGPDKHHILEGATIMHGKGGTWRLNGAHCRQTSAGTPLFADMCTVEFSNCRIALLGGPASTRFTECPIVRFTNTSVAVDSDAPVLLEFQKCSVKLSCAKFEHVVFHADGCPVVAMEAAALSNVRLANGSSATISDSIVSTQHQRFEPALVVEKSSNATLVNVRLFAHDSSLVLLVTNASRCTVSGDTELHCVFNSARDVPEAILVTIQSDLVCPTPPRVTAALLEGSLKVSRPICTVSRGSEIQISRVVVDGLQIDCDSTSHSREPRHHWLKSVWIPVGCCAVLLAIALR